MTCEVVIISTRKEGWTHDECVGYFEQEHVPLIEELPGLKRFVTSVPVDPEQIDSAIAATGSRFDIVSRLRFECLDDLRAALSAEEARRIQRDARIFSDLEECVVFVRDGETLRYQTVPETL